MRLMIALATLVCGTVSVSAAPLVYRDGQVATGAHGMVVSQQPLATRVGLETLKNGGNAIDAAVATALALAVVHPQAGNLGGGGFLLFYRASDSLCTVIDCRETAPAAASRDMYLDAKGNADSLRSRVGPWASGVPGTPAGLYLAWSKYGRRPWRSLVAPAIRYAQDGFSVNEDLAAAVDQSKDKLKAFPASADIFLPHGRPLRAGDKLQQRDLARTLRLLAQSGPLTFYEGAISEIVAKEMERVQGPIKRADLAGYRATERTPLRGRYRDLEVIVVPPPSSGGVTLLEMLAILEHWQISATGPRSTYRVHLTAEAMARAFADRNTHLGDPAFIRPPVTGLLAAPYIKKLIESIDPEHATPRGKLQPGDPWPWEPGGHMALVPADAAWDTLRTAPPEPDHTTHLSVVDAAGNIASFTTTLNDEFGSGFMVAGAGFLLNNEMDDFTAKPGTPNMYGLVGGEANAIAAGKRPLSSMCPTIVRKGGHPWLVLGSPGGPRIITTVLNILVDVRDHGVTLETAVATPRFHHQWQPDLIYYEPGAFTDDVRNNLTAMGHALRERTPYSSAQCIEILPNGTRRGVSDPRSRGAALGY